MSILRRALGRAPEHAATEPEDFCDVCGNPVYASDLQEVRLQAARFILHGTCALQLENALMRTRWQRGH